MIRLTRVRTKTAIPTALRGQKRLEKALTLLIAAGAVHEFDSDYWKKAKKQLKAEAHGKCAYCEAPTATVAHGDVEHFRPKSVYWWLAYCYDNYLFSCQICNQTYKKDAFPLGDELLRSVAPLLAATATEAERLEFARRLAPDPLDTAEGMTWADWEAACRAEGALLLNPYQDEPETHFSWQADAALQEVRLKPRSDASQAVLDAAEQHYGLNRAELLAERWKTYRKLSIFRKSYLAPELAEDLRTEVEEELRHMTAPDAAFSGMCRYFVRVEWQLPL